MRRGTAPVPVAGSDRAASMPTMRSIVTAALFGLACTLAAQEARRPPEPDARTDARLMETAWRLRGRGEEVAAQARVRELLERQPENFEARAFLGQQFFRGRWRLTEEIAYLRRAERDAAAAAATTPPSKPVEPAAAPTPWLPRAREWPLAPIVAAASPQSGSRPRTRSAVFGMFDVRLQSVKLLGIDTVPVSFGNGNGGRLQLPRTESVSFGGAVCLPLGFGQ